MRLFLDAHGFHELLSPEQKAEATAWLDTVTGDRHVFTAEMVSEGRLRLLASLKGDERQRPSFVRYGDDWVTFMCRAVYTDIQPPPPFIAAMAVVGERTPCFNGP